MDNVRGLARIIASSDGLGALMTHQMDILARNAFLDAPFARYGTATGTKFNSVAETDTVSTQMIDEIVLGMKVRGIPTMQTGNGSPGSLVCITTPGVLYDLKREVGSNPSGTQWIDVMKYADPTRIINGEVGSYHGVRFVESNELILWNNGRYAGGVGAQTTITAAASADDGAPDPATTAVDVVEYVGQAAATHSITVADSSGFTVGDVVTIHTDRTSTLGVTNGVDYHDGTIVHRRIVAIASGTSIAVHKPLMKPFTTDLGGGVYGYVTLARDIHPLIFIAANDGVVMGVAQPPQIYTPRPVDDFDMIQRFTYDMYLGWQAFNKDAFEVAYVAATNRVTGAAYTR